MTLGAAVLGWSLPAHADTVDGTRSAAVSEERHLIALEIARDHATLRVERRLYNGGTRHDQALIGIDLPSGAVATGLRTLGSLHGRPEWFEGELLEAEEAARRYESLTGIGGYYPKDPALLSYRYPSFLMLQVFPLAPAAPKSVGYTLELPTAYRDGAYHVTIPRMGTETLAARVSATTADASDRVFVDGKPYRRGSTLETREKPLDFALVPSSFAAFDGELATVSFAPGRTLTRFSVRAAPKLSEVPKGAYLVVLIDGSRSTSPGFADAAKLALDAYLSHFVDARVAVLVFDRRVRREVPAFLALPAARARLRSLTFERKNGSHVDMALFEASELLASAPARAPKRIVMLTDGYTRSNLTAERVRGALRSTDIITHVGLLEPGPTFLERNDEHLWAKALRPSGGLTWSARAPERITEDGERTKLESTYEELARPLRIDQLDVFSSNDAFDSELAGRLPTWIAEGEGVDELFVAASAAPAVRVQGELWAEPLSFSAQSSPAREKLWAALVFGSRVLDELTEAEMMPLAMLGGAVSPVTSYLAIEPGVRPSTEGLEPEERVHRPRSPSVRMGGTLAGQGRGLPLDREAFLRDQLEPEWHRCGGAAGAATLLLETTLSEIVSVAVQENPPSGDPILVSCMEEAVWALPLPSGFVEEWAPYAIDL